eukprot:11217698-Ditylum_brightwellii.AAC.1
MESIWADARWARCFSVAHAHDGIAYFLIVRRVTKLGKLGVGEDQRFNASIKGFGGISKAAFIVFVGTVVDVVVGGSLFGGRNGLME